MAKHKGGAGRNKEFCKRYAHEGRREKNKVRKMVRTMKRQPMNKQTATALEKYNPKLAQPFLEAIKEAEDAVRDS